MNTLQQQITILAQKVDELSQRIEQLSERLSEVVTECQFGAEQAQRSEGRISDYRSYASNNRWDSALEHKDILLDGDRLDGQSGDRQLSPEIQIQRLTAQLTAAYNRMAALEEQLLLKQRVH
jgi:SMC interacting uncharacterized protein involved in chromosome segregation